MPAGARSVAEKLGIRYVFACFHPFGSAGEGRGGTMRTDGTTVAAKLLLAPGASDGQARE
ncbi:hypothetical protein [Streptomyces sp. DSM 41534]